MSLQQVIIIGGKGTAINIADQIVDARLRFGYPMEVLGFAIDDASLGNEIAGFPVVCGVREAWSKYRDTGVGFIFSLYRPDVMRDRVALLRDLGIPADRFTNFIHPSAYVARSVSMGSGNVILSQACLQHGVRLGNNNIINAQVVIEHESRLHDSAFIAACACIGARVRVGNGVFVGLNATIREDVTLGDYAFVGMSSVVLHSVEEDKLVYGVPARPRL